MSVRENSANNIAFGTSEAELIHVDPEEINDTPGSENSKRGCKETGAPH